MRETEHGLGSGGKASVEEDGGADWAAARVVCGGDLGGDVAVASRRRSRLGDTVSGHGLGRSVAGVGGGAEDCGGYDLGRGGCVFGESREMARARVCGRREKD
ncbi:hypothetical protein M0R45_007810 [Rubus argutus]|uniref:Uncharacterized protein n=1 Tax=Rubus argutus TaxID=59490 RepID=A0AAW1Y2S1_RUBAR